MTTIAIELDDDLKAFVEARAAAMRLATVDEYIQRVIGQRMAHAARRDSAHERLQAWMASPTAPPVDEDWAALFDEEDAPTWLVRQAIREVSEVAERYRALRDAQLEGADPVAALRLAVLRVIGPLGIAPGPRLGLAVRLIEVALQAADWDTLCDELEDQEAAMPPS